MEGSTCYTAHLRGVPGTPPCLHRYQTAQYHASLISVAVLVVSEPLKHTVTYFCHSFFSAHTRRLLLYLLYSALSHWWHSINSLFVLLPLGKWLIPKQVKKHTQFNQYRAEFKGLTQFNQYRAEFKGLSMLTWTWQKTCFGWQGFRTSLLLP